MKPGAKISPQELADTQNKLNKLLDAYVTKFDTLVLAELKKTAKELNVDLKKEDNSGKVKELTRKQLIEAIRNGLKDASNQQFTKLVQVTDAVDDVLAKLKTKSEFDQRAVPTETQALESHKANGAADQAALVASIEHLNKALEALKPEIEKKNVDAKPTLLNRFAGIVGVASGIGVIAAGLVFAFNPVTFFAAFPFLQGILASVSTSTLATAALAATTTILGAFFTGLGGYTFFKGKSEPEKLLSISNEMSATAKQFIEEVPQADIQIAQEAPKVPVVPTQNTDTVKQDVANNETVMTHSAAM